MQEELVPMEEDSVGQIMGNLIQQLGRPPTREEALVALGAPLVYKDSAGFVPEQHIGPYLAANYKTTVSPLVEMVAPAGEDMLLGELFACFTQWHVDRNLVDGATDETQFVKLLEEVCELFASINPELNSIDLYMELRVTLDRLHYAGKINQAKDSCILDDVGDINVLLTNFLARREESIGSALLHAWDDIKDRKGMMINGVYVKEADLTEADLEEPRV